MAPSNYLRKLEFHRCEQNTPTMLKKPTAEIWVTQDYSLIEEWYVVKCQTLTDYETLND